MDDINIDSHFGAIIIRLLKLVRRDSQAGLILSADLISSRSTLSRIRTEIEISRVKSHWRDCAFVSCRRSARNNRGSH